MYHHYAPVLCCCMYHHYAPVLCRCMHHHAAWRLGSLCTCCRHCTAYFSQRHIYTSCMLKCIHAYTCILACIHTHIYTYRLFIYVHTRIMTHVSYIHTYIHTYMHAFLHVDHTKQQIYNTQAESFTHLHTAHTDASFADRATIKSNSTNQSTQTPKHNART